MWPDQAVQYLSKKFNMNIRKLNFQNYQDFDFVIRDNMCYGDSQYCGYVVEYQDPKLRDDNVTMVRLELGHHELSGQTLKLYKRRKKRILGRFLKPIMVELVKSPYQSTFFSTGQRKRRLNRQFARS